MREVSVLPTGILQGNAMDSIPELQGLTQDWADIVRDTMAFGTLLGQGTRGKVYALSQSPEYVLYVSHEVAQPPTELQMVEVEDSAPGINIGQPVMNLQGDHIRVLRYQAGDTFPIDYASLFKKYNLTKVLSLGESVHLKDILSYRDGYCNQLKRIEAMPQKAYDNLALTLLAVTECGLHVDPCSLNVLVHPNGESFTTLDHFENVGPYANVLGMACSLLDTMYLDLDEYALDSHGQLNTNPLSQCTKLIQIRQSILNK